MDRIRPALLADLPALNALIRHSARELSRGFYSTAITESLIEHLFGVDTQLLHDGTYFVVEREGRVVGCGGWSARRALYGGDQAKPSDDSLLDPQSDAARIRAFFVDPSCARQGLGRMLLTHCEAEARAAGFRRVELMATLPGVPLYRALGYHEVEPIRHELPDGARADFIRMARLLD